MEDHKTDREFGELRQDLITGKWVVVATGRAKRPNTFAEERSAVADIKKYKSDCPFCNLAQYPQEPDVLLLPDDPDEWQVHVFPNKFPAFRPGDELRSWNVGPYRALDAIGHHELTATRWHNEFDGLISQSQWEVQLEALVMRYRQLKVMSSVNYIQIIKNHGPAAGGSLEHPHHQIFTVPIIPSDVHDLLHGAQTYYEKNKKEVFDVMLDFEREDAQRIVFENERFTVFCPYASRVPFEVWVVPNKPLPYFDECTPHDRSDLAEAMQFVMSRIYHGLKNPDYNYYIHSAPCDDTGFVCDRSTFQNFRWHIQVLPRLNVWGGFELGTGLEITTALPEESAQFLREVSLPAKL